MTTTEKDIQIALGTYLSEVWKESCKIYDEGYKLIYEGDKLIDEEWNLTAEGKKLIAEGYKLIVDGDILFIDAVEEIYGKDMTIQWTSYGCKLGNGLEFRD